MICLENTFYQSHHSNIASAVSGDRQVSKMRARAGDESSAGHPGVGGELNLNCAKRGSSRLSAGKGRRGPGQGVNKGWSGFVALIKAGPGMTWLDQRLLASTRERDGCGARLRHQQGNGRSLASSLEGEVVCAVGGRRRGGQCARIDITDNILIAASVRTQQHPVSRGQSSRTQNLLKNPPIPFLDVCLRFLLVMFACFRIRCWRSTTASYRGQGVGPGILSTENGKVKLKYNYSATTNSFYYIK